MDSPVPSAQSSLLVPFHLASCAARCLCWIGFSLSLGGVLLARGSAMPAPLPDGNSAKNVPALPATRRALGPNTAAGLPPFSLSILVSSNKAAQLVVSGTNGGTYGIASTEDFLRWTTWPVQTADTNGRTTFAISLSSPRLFFRAFSTGPTIAKPDPPEVAIGKRLFLETRFAQFFFAHSRGDVNASLANGGDPVMDKTVTVNTTAPGPFAGQSMNCRACHLVDEQKASGLGTRANNDFSIRSPIPDRGDGRAFTVRNSPSLANASIARPGAFFLHFDGEFTTGASLVEGTATGRNFGWLPTERKQAVSHIAKVIREDNGQDLLGRTMGGAYRTVLAATDPGIPAAFRLPQESRTDVSKASDGEILEALAKLVDAYLKSLVFVTNEAGEYDASPYDVFLKKNSFPRRPAAGENDKSYSRRLRALVANLKSPVFVTAEDGSFATHAQEFSFGPAELEGFKIFFAEPGDNSSLPGGIGNCITCHAAPRFTDFSFHNTGATQWEYDSIHGEGTFAQIPVPSLAERLVAPDNFLPPTSNHPNAKGRFMSVPGKEAPGSVDLGLWNVYANPDFPAPQVALQALLSVWLGLNAADALLPKTIALFKTPGLRDLGHSAPYLHTGQASTIESVVFFYRFTSDLAREQRVRNGDPEMAKIILAKETLAPLSAFLRSLNEDYE